MSTEEKVIEIIAEQLSMEKEKVIPTAKLEADLGSDSLDLVELIITLEDLFDIKITNEAAEQANTVKGVIDIVEFCLNIK